MGAAGTINVKGQPHPGASEQRGTLPFLGSRLGCICMVP